MSLQEFLKKVARDIEKMKRQVAKKNSYLLAEDHEWYSIWFAPSLPFYSGYHEKAVMSATAYIVTNPYDIFDSNLIDDLIDNAEPKACFNNAMMVAENEQADYIEGYIVNTETRFAVLHAWNKLDGKYLDITGEGQASFDWQALGLKNDEDRDPFRLKSVYVELQSLPADEAIALYTDLGEELMEMVGGSVFMAQRLHYLNS